jgi:hypothetical protein
MKERKGELTLILNLVSGTLLAQSGRTWYKEEEESVSESLLQRRRIIFRLRLLVDFVLLLRSLDLVR